VSAKNSDGDVYLGEIEGDVVAQTSSGSIIVGLATQPKADSQLVAPTPTFSTNDDRRRAGQAQ